MQCPNCKEVEGVGSSAARGYSGLELHECITCEQVWRVRGCSIDVIKPGKVMNSQAA